MKPKPLPPATALALVFLVLSSAEAPGQCILANPSFEIGGSGGAVFGGWSQFGTIGAVTTAVHGARAARVSGPNQGGWDVSGYWQPLDCAPGERWAVTGHVRHPGSKPLTGQCIALVNLEWRDAGGNLISYDSHTVADASMPTDTYLDFSFVSAAAPAGTVKTRLLLGVLQSPADPSPDVHFDQITCHSTTPPTIDDKQWMDFPGGTTLVFGGRTWRVKGPGYYGPGGNLFSNAASSVWVDASARLHLTLKRVGGSWYSTEVVVEQPLGYGDYIVTTVGRLDQLDPQAVLGLFLWQYGDCWDEGYLWWNAFNEIDIEYSRWGNPVADIGQFVAQPYDYPGNIRRFAATFGDNELSSHAMRWLPDRVEYRVWRGGPGDESPATTVSAWTYAGPHIPRPEQPRLHLNLWKLGGTPAADQEVIFQNFTFVPEGLTAVAAQQSPASPATPAGRLHPAAPNPFNPSTTARFDLIRGGHFRLAVYDLGGGSVRTLASGDLPAGSHSARWDGRDDHGRPLPSGVYILRLQGSNFSDSRPVVLTK